jgi:peroxiredoxin
VQQATPSIPQEIGATVVDFTLMSIAGQVVNLRTSLRASRGAVVSFWSSVCSHCIRYDLFFNNFGRQHPELLLLAIASRQGETFDQLRTSAEKRKLQFAILHDHDGSVAGSWFVQQTPRVFLVDNNGVLRYRGAVDNYKYPGDIDYIPYLEPAIEQFLSGKQLSRTDTASFGCAIRSVYYKFPKAL